MRLGWLVSAGVCALVVACGSSTHKKVLICDASVCDPVEDAGAAGSSTGPGNAPGAAGEGGSGNEAGASADAGAPPQIDGGSDAGAAAEGGVAPSAQLEVTLAGNGSVAVTDAAACLIGSCEYPSNDGTVLSLEAKPGADSRFVGWSGACSGSNPKTTVTVSGLKACIATFAIQRAVAATVDVVGDGTVTSNPNLACNALGCSGQVDDQSNLTLNATPAVGFRFVSWSGSPECAGATQASLALVVTKDIACTAKFSRQFLLSISSAGANAPVSVTSGTCVATMCTADADASATFTANALAGYRFSGWSGDVTFCTGAVEPLQVEHIASDISCVANYAARFKVTGLVGSGLTGTVTATSGDVNASCPPNSNACIVDSGTSTTLVAPTIAGYRLTGWTGAGCTGAQSGNGLVVTPLTGDLTCTATYAQGVSVTGTVVGATGTVTAASNSPGADCTKPGGCSIDAGGSVTLTAPNLLPTFRFVNWTGDPGCAGGALPITVSNVMSSESCKANYIQEFTILAKANAGGTATAAVGGNACAGNSCTVDANVGVTLTANPDSANGFHFSGWTGASCTPAANTPLALSNVSTTCTANFALNTFTIAATTGTNGGVSATRNDTAAQCANGACTVSFGTSVTLLATPSAHYHFVSWAGPGCAPTTNASLTLSNLNATCAASFAIDTFNASVSAAPPAGGTVNITCPGSCAAVPYGQPINVTEAPNAGWVFSAWSVNCAGGSATVTGPTACVAGFRPTVTAAVSPTAAGTVSATGAGNLTCTANPTSCALDSGSSITLVATPASNAVFTNWTGDCTGTAKTVTLSNVTAPLSCTASFYQLWAVSSGNTGFDDTVDVTALADGTVVSLANSLVFNTRASRPALVNLGANTGKLGRNQILVDKAGGGLVPLGLTTSQNTKNVVALAAHTGKTDFALLHNEQAPTWDWDYGYAGGTTVSNSGEVIATRDGGYAFGVGVLDTAANVTEGHLTKVDGQGNPVFDLRFCATDPKLNCIATEPVDLLEDPAGKYFVVLSQVLNANNEIMLTFVNEDGTFNGSTRFADGAASLDAAQLAVGAAADTFLVTGLRVLGKDGNGFYAELPKAAGRPAFAFTVGSDGPDEELAAVVATAKGYALAGLVRDANGNQNGWLLFTNAAGAISSQFSYGAGGESFTSIFALPAGGFALGGVTSTWGAGLDDLWTLRLDDAGAITFNATAPVATRAATAYAATAITTIAPVTTAPKTAPVLVSQSAATLTLTAAGFTQTQQAP
jgi:hypothetical protein